ncbi:MAG: glycosyltransferase family 2 protein [Marinilabiliales bacterium]|nr:glycosyltransferase family 2 protein [Marinilabiliales bacterium]
MPRWLSRSRTGSKTIGDAIRSVLSQKTKYSFNLIIVDNYSTDGTTDVIRSFAGRQQGGAYHSREEGSWHRRMLERGRHAATGAAGLPSSSTVMTSI